MQSWVGGGPASSKSGDQSASGARFLVSFVGSGRLFSDVVLRTIEAELEDVRAASMPDVNTWALVQRDGSRFGHLMSRLLIVDEHDAAALCKLIDTDAGLLETTQLVLAVRSETSAQTLLQENTDCIARHRVSLLPMNLNLSAWIQVVRLIDCGVIYLPPELILHASRRALDVSVGADLDAPIVVPDGSANGAGARPLDIEMPGDDRPSLTPRESEVLKLVAQGQPNKVIAAELDVSSHTVKLHIHRIISKLGVKNRTEAAAWYHQTRHV